MKYFRVLDQLSEPPNRWFLKSINIVEDKKISLWNFLMPFKIELPENVKLAINIRTKGEPLDFTFADFDVLIVNEKVALLFNEGECQLIPIKIDGISDSHEYYVCVILRCVECLDESRSVFDKFAIDDPVRPDKAGQYRGIYKLVIDHRKINDERIFRLKNAENIIIVNEELRREIEDSDITGIHFRDVN